MKVRRCNRVIRLHSQKKGGVTRKLGGVGDSSHRMKRMDGYSATASFERCEKTMGPDVMSSSKEQ